jgi:L-lactate dehydrogenase complex protein LldG
VARPREDSKKFSLVDKIVILSGAKDLCFDRKILGKARMSETTAAREAILNRIRATNDGANPSMRESDYRAISRMYQQAPSMDRETILKIWIERLRDYDAQIFETTPQRIASAIAEALHSHNQRSAVVADDFPPQLLPEGFYWQCEASTTTEQLNTAEGAISGCEVAIAHTGSIVIKGVRKPTLLPDRYLCIVYEDQVVETVPEAIALLEQFATEPLTFISGPSATADIEMTRIRGVHGPRFLDVVLVRN